MEMQARAGVGGKAGVEERVKGLRVDTISFLHVLVFLFFSVAGVPVFIVFSFF